MEDDPLFRRTRQHAELRLSFNSGQSDKQRIEQIKEFMRLEKEMLLRYHQKGDSGLRVTRARSVILDVLIQNLFSYAIEVANETIGKIKPMCVLATGGYGRGELSPHSDIDLMFLYHRTAMGKSLDMLKETMTREILYPLWDTGLKVGHASREVKEALVESQKDIRNKNSMLDARFLCGDRKVAQKFIDKFHKFCRKNNPSDYLKELLSHQQERRLEKGSTVFLQAPDVKNGVGGLRDYQGVLWMTKVKFEKHGLSGLIRKKYLSKQEAKSMEDAYSFLLRVRNELHFRSKRPVDILHLEKQPEIALGLGYEEEDIFRRVELFMEDYYTKARTISQLSDILEQRLVHANAGSTSSISIKNVIRAYQSPPTQEVDGFDLISEQLSTQNPKIFDEDPERLIRLFRHSQRLSAKLSPDLRSLVRNRLSLIDSNLINSSSANVTFRSILQEIGNVSPTLCEMHELGVLGRFVPEFGRLTCKVQHDLYHRFTADIHVLHCITILDQIFQGKKEDSKHYLEALRKNEIPGLLYLILFLHDLGKDKGPKGHCERGVEIAVNLMDRLGISEEMRDRILFVIRNHLEMVRYANKFDLEDPEVIDSFAQFVEGEQRLRFLYVHTFCDANATAPDLWNSHKEELHTQLFNNTLAVLEGKRARKDPNTLKDAYKNMEVDGVSRQEILEHLEQVPVRYFSHSGKEEVALHVDMIHRFLQNTSEKPVPVINWRDDLRRSLTIVDIVTRDRNSLFEKLTGAFSIAGLNILGARAVTRKDGLAIDVFYVEDKGGGTVEDPETREHCESSIRSFLADETSPDQLIREQRKKTSRTQLFSNEDKLGEKIASQVDVYRDVSLNRTIVEVRAPDQVGLLHLISKTISSCGFSIQFARIATEQGIATDIFNIEPLKSKEPIDPARFLQLREQLSSALYEGKFYHEV
ncbi:MAG: [protein-PII] uridylyltransferase [Verrucomicrobiota bacterium]|nr:[protein-PII] uridylyltransferase [Verrucomicrobiota bacterium]